MAWGEMPITCHERLKPAVEMLVECVRPIEVRNQIIQGDPDNILFAEGVAPAIIDFCPYWRPSEFALAVLVVDKLVWEKADRSILQAFADISEFPQLLVRAELRRVLELDGHFQQFGKDCLEEVDAHLSTIEFIGSLAKS
jgi:fructosamine-3-kinase